MLQNESERTGPYSVANSLCKRLWTCRKTDYRINEHTVVMGDRGSTVVKALCYTSEGHWFDPSR